MNSITRTSLANIKKLFKDVLFRRIAKNVAMLSSGKGASAILGLAYLAIATHTLGVRNFGILILVHTYIVVIREFTSFSTAQSVIRYGAVCIKDSNRGSFQDLIKFTFMLDMFSAILGTIIAILLMPIMGPWFGLNDENTPLATLYCFAILFNFKSTAIGIQRLFNRFDLLAKQMLVIPVVRLTGAIIAFLTESGVLFFLLVWFIASSTSTFVNIWMGAREFIRHGYHHGMNWRLTGLTANHTNIWSFVWITNIHITLKLTVSQVTTLLVGFILGPSSAGLFKIAQEAANVLVKPAQLFTETLYPELAKLVTTASLQKMWRVIIRAGLIGAAIACTVLIIIAFFGEFLLAVIFGAEFTGSFEVLLLLILAGGITMSTFAFDPAFYAIGRPDIPMKVKILTSMLHLLITFYLLVYIGLNGAGIAAITSGFATALLMYSYAMRLIKNN